MIARIKGEVLGVRERALIVDVRDLGYLVFVTGTVRDSHAIGDTIDLWTHLISRDDSLDLYGFERESELTLFAQLITISGVGPKSALAIIGIAPVETLTRAIASEDISYLTQVSGVGKKSAQKIILELKDKVGAVGELESLGLREDVEVLEALRALGYTEREARDAVQHLDASLTSTQTKITAALQYLGGN